MNKKADGYIKREPLMLQILDYIDEYAGIDDEGLHSEKWCAMMESKMAIEDQPAADVIEVSAIKDYMKMLQAKRDGCKGYDGAEANYIYWDEMLKSIQSMLDALRK